MKNPMPGDIILIRGRRFRHSISRWYLRSHWNHALLYFGDGETQELTWRGVGRRSYKEYCDGKQIAVFRLQTSDALASIRLMFGTNNRAQAFTDAMNELQDTKFDWFSYFGKIFGLSRLKRRNNCLCDEYVNRVYKAASNKFGPNEASPRIDCTRLVKKNYSGNELRDKFNLTKVYDYRWK